MKQVTQTLIQCDFDGTVTDKDASFLMLDAFGRKDWRQLFQQYQEGEITIGHFNTLAFATITADKQALLEHIKGRIKIRAGFSEMVSCCRSRGFRFVIVSNGLNFYISRILRDAGMADIEVRAAQTHFHPYGLKVQYIGPDGKPLDNDFKLAYVDLFLNEGYRMVYIGNGDSDFSPAQRCHHIFATDTLLECCRQANRDCVPFVDFHDVIRAMERL